MRVGHHNRLLRLVVSIALVAASILLHPRASAQCTDQWLFGPDQGDPGIPGDVYAALEWTMNTPSGPRQVLVAGGLFKSAGQTLANSLAYWDGEWHAFGAGLDPNQSPYNQSIRALCIYQGDLIAAGNFHHIDGVAASNIARWNGSTWQPLASGVDNTVNALCVIGDILYVGGRFSTAGAAAAPSIAAWNGSSWSTPGSGLPDSSGRGVQTLVEFQGQLRAGGRFTLSGNTYGLASWNGATWQGNSVQSPVTSICVYGDSLYVANATSAAQKWTGAAWTAVGAPGNRFNNIQTFAVHNGKLVAGGTSSVAAGALANSIAAWDGSTWSPIGTGIRNPNDGSDFVIRSLTTFGASLIAAGTFVSDAPLSRSITQWNGESWKALGHGICTPPAPSSLLADQAPLVGAFSTWNGDLVMGGLFSGYGSTPSSTIALRHNGEWKALADGLTHSSDTSYVGSIISFGNQLIAGGSFNRSGQTTLNNIAAWNGVQWSALGLGLNKYVHSLAVFNGDLIAAGQFTVAGTTEALRVARWDGTEWHALGTGANDTIYELAVYQGKLIAAGTFTSIGDIDAAHIASWDGATWAPLGAGIDDPAAFVVALAVHNGRLIAGGAIHSAGGVAVQGVAQWDGQTWSPVGLGSPDGVAALATHRGELFATGKFILNSPPSIYGLAKWDGSSWQSVGIGFDNPGYSLFSNNTELLIGGSFSRINNQVSIAWARYGGCSFCPADLNGDNLVNEADFAIFSTAYDILDCADQAMPANCASDLTNDGLVDDADFLAFITAYDAMTCP